MKKLYIGNLPYDFDGRKLESLFAKYGTVESAVIINDRYTGRSKGFGFVEIDDEGSKKAIEELAGMEVQGRPLKVNIAKPLVKDNSGYRR